jgi:hypothetical protein
MTDRTIIAVVTDLVNTGLTVEQTILVTELAILSGDMSGDKLRAKWRENKRKQRMSRDMSEDKEIPPIPPKENILYITPFGKGVKGKTLLSEDTFEGFWSIYPRKVAKGSAKRAYRNALKRASAEEILAGAQRYASTKPDPQFTAHAASWLNADRWLDEPDKLPKPVGTKGTEGFVAEWKDAAKRQVEDREKIVKAPAEDREAQVARYLKARPMP